MQLKIQGRDICLFEHAMSILHVSLTLIILQNKGRTAIHAAAENENWEILEYLLEKFPASRTAVEVQNMYIAYVSFHSVVII